MDQINVGKFIAEKRKNKSLTQMELAEKLNITDRAVSKWECGKSLPDASIMLDLCEILEISVNELLTGEELEMKDYNKQAELNLVEMTKQKEEADKRLLKIEIVMGILSTVFLFTLIIIGAIFFAKDDDKRWVFFLMFGIGFVQFIICMLFATRIEQKAGYYECQNCHDKHEPSFGQVIFAMHINRTRYMKCPCCGKRTWQKKVTTNNEWKD